MSQVTLALLLGALLPFQMEKEERALAAIETARTREAPNAIIGLCSYLLTDPELESIKDQLAEERLDAFAALEKSGETYFREGEAVEIRELVLVDASVIRGWISQSDSTKVCIMPIRDGARPIWEAPREIRCKHIKSQKGLKPIRIDQAQKMLQDALMLQFDSHVENGRHLEAVQAMGTLLRRFPGDSSNEFMRNRKDALEVAVRALASAEEPPEGASRHLDFRAAVRQVERMVAQSRDGVINDIKPVIVYDYFGGRHQYATIQPVEHQITSPPSGLEGKTVSWKFRCVGQEGNTIIGETESRWGKADLPDFRDILTRSELSLFDDPRGVFHRLNFLEQQKLLEQFTIYNPWTGEVEFRASGGDLLHRLQVAEAEWKHGDEELKNLKRTEYGKDGRRRWNDRKRPYEEKRKDAYDEYKRLLNEKTKMLRIIYNRLRNVKHNVFVHVGDTEVQIPENGFVELVGEIEGIEWDRNTVVPAITLFVKLRPEDGQSENGAAP